MTSHPPGPCCVNGRLLTGETRGKVETINGIETYITSPFSSARSSHPQAIIFLTEACGIYLPHDQLLADAISSSGNYTVVMPDLFHGDPHPYNDSSVDLYKWLAKHPVERVDPVVRSTLQHIRESLGFERIGAVGYCFGAKYVIRWLGRPRGIDVGFVAHPSFVESEELRSIEGPLSIAAAESDYIFTVEKRHESEAMLRELEVPWQINLYSGVKHSFAVRGDPVVRKEMWAKEQALQQALCWFEEHLKTPGDS